LVRILVRALLRRSVLAIRRRDSAVVDVVFVMITIVFFALCVAYVRICDGIIGPDEPTRDTAADASWAERS
jgi:hypothetical protein